MKRITCLNSKTQAGHAIEQVALLRTLSADIDLHNKMFLEARPVLIEYDWVPKEMNEEEWTRVIYALRGCYQSVKFLFTIAKLVEAKVIHTDILYILYYYEVAGYLTEKLGFLVQWCGIGLDLAADYDSYTLARMINALMGLLNQLNAIHEENGADLCNEGHEAVIAYFEEKARDFLSDPGRFAVGSDNYVDNYIEIKE